MERKEIKSEVSGLTIDEISKDAKFYYPELFNYENWTKRNPIADEALRKITELFPFNSTDSYRLINSASVNVK